MRSVDEPWTAYAPVAASSAANMSKPHPVPVGMPGAPGVAGAIRARLSRLRIGSHRLTPIWQPAGRTVKRRMGRLADTFKVPRRKAEPAFGLVSVSEAMTLLFSSRAYSVAVQNEYDVIDIPVTSLDKVTSGGVEL